MTNKQSFAHADSGNVEFYTPELIVGAARVAMGGIDLDPASCENANRVVRAPVYYSPELGLDGLSLPWFGRVFLNHPFGKYEKACKPRCVKKTCRERGYHLTEDKPGNAAWIDRLVVEYRRGRVAAACCVTWANMSEGWFRPLLEFPHCLPYGRVHYRKPDGTIAKQANKGSVITYLGPDLDAFAAAFEPIGAVYARHSLTTPTLSDNNTPRGN